jgi:FkbM family methyltransferase
MNHYSDFRVRDDLQRMQPDGDFAYALLAHTRPSLCLDVGAAAGDTVAKIKKYAPDTRVLAFEPFPGNISFFEKSTAAMTGVTLIEKAVSNDRGMQEFFVPHIVQQTTETNHWSTMAGYSSVGFLVPDDNHLDKSKIIRVERCRLDDLAAERVGLLKIDVQGTEFEVLDGAHRLLNQFGVDIIFSEFIGDRRVLELLDTKGYDVFDTAYMVFTPGNPVGAMLDRPQSFPLSTGARGYSGYLGQDIARDMDSYCSFFQHGGFQTDLFAVKRERANDVLEMIGPLTKA